MRLLGTLLLVMAIVSVLASAAFQDFKRERSGENAKLKDALEGKPPPALKAREWVNLTGDAPTWKSLKGKVVLLDFWAWW